MVFTQRVGGKMKRVIKSITNRKTRSKTAKATAGSSFAAPKTAAFTSRDAKPSLARPRISSYDDTPDRPKTDGGGAVCRRAQLGRAACGVLERKGTVSVDSAGDRADAQQLSLVQARLHFASQ